MGTRIYELAGQFLQWRFRKLTLRYVPWTSASGVVSIPAGTSSTPSYSSRPFCWGVVFDPAILTLNYMTLRAYGGRFGQSDKSSSLSFSGNVLSKWLYTSTTVSIATPPSTIDYRMTSPGTLRWYFGDSSTTNTQTHGVIQYDAVVEFRFPSYNALPIGVDLRRSESMEQDEKHDASPVSAGGFVKVAARK